MQRWLLIIALILGNSGILASRVLAQIIPDNTLGDENSVVTPINANQDRIDGGAIRGSNLFHSFQEFSIIEGNSAYFANPAAIQNIFSRVTGSNPSQILGTLGVLGEANLFFINPNGIIFGKNASLDLKGSFLGSTANSFTFPDGSQFSATNPQAAPLLDIQVQPPQVGLVFGDESKGNIVNQGNLIVPKDLTLAADNLDLQGQLIAGENLTLQGNNTVLIRDSFENPFIAASGKDLLVQGNQTVDIFALNHPDSGLFSGGNMILRSNNEVIGDAHYYSGGSFRIENLEQGLGDLLSENDPVIRAYGDVVLSSYTGASLHIIAGGFVYIPGTIRITGADSQYGLVETITLSNGEQIAINGKTQPTLDIRAGVSQDAIGLPLGVTGNVSGVFYDSIPDSADIVIGNVIFNRINGTGGQVFLTNQYQPNTELPTLFGGIDVGLISTRDLFGGGNVVIDARSNIVLNSQINVSSFDLNLLNSTIFPKNTYLGNGGNVTLLSQGDITFNSGSSISSQGLLGGNIELNSRGDIFITNSVIGTENYSTELGQGGDINVYGQNVSLTNNSLIGTNTYGQATGGDLFFDVNFLSATNGVLLGTVTQAQGDAGNVTINADKIVLDRQNETTTQIVSRSYLGGEGKAGDIIINTDNLQVLNKASIVSITSGTGDAGNVIINPIDRVNGSSTVILNNGFIDSTSENGSEGNGGDVIINTGRTGVLEVKNGSLIFTTMQGSGDGGDITINTGSLQLLNGGLISSAVVRNGDGGNIIINATDKVIFDRQNGTRTGVLSEVLLKAQGNTGSISITTGNLQLLNGAQISSSIREDGKGNAGDITINAPNITFDGYFVDSEGNQKLSGLSALLLGEGSAGNINITTSNLQLLKGGTISASTSGIGNAGNITIQPINNTTNKIVLDSGDNRIQTTISSQVLQNGVGNAGIITINTDSLEVKNGAQILSTISGIGNPGKIIIDATDNIIFDNFNSGVNSSVKGVGNAGDITINTGKLEINNGAAIVSSIYGTGNGGKITVNTDILEINEEGNIFANTFGVGDAGNITINATENILLNNGNISTLVGVQAIGNAGNITINTGNLELLNKTAIFASSSGKGKAGNITINTDILEMSNSYISSDTASIEGSFFSVGDAGTITINATENILLDKRSYISTGVSENATGNGGNITINTGNLELLNNTQISASTSGYGKAGNLTINTDILEIKNGSLIIASTLGQGDAGNVTINATDRVILDTQGGNVSGVGSQVSKVDGQIGVGNAGTVEINTGILEVLNGASISTSTNSIGNAGSVTINATNSVLFDGKNKDGNGSGAFSRVNEGAEGNAGGILINTPQLTMSNGGQISAETKGAGNAGNISIANNNLNAKNITLDNSTISTSVNQSATGEGGTISIKTNTLNLNNNSQISSSTDGEGNAGSISVKDANTLNLNNSSISTEIKPNGIATERSNIDLITNILSLTHSEIKASTLGKGDAGIITINANESTSLDHSKISSTVEPGATEDAGEITITSPNISLSNDSEISTSTDGQGNAGKIELNAAENVNISNSEVSSAVGSQGVGQAGTVTINAPNISIIDGSTLSSTAGKGNASDVTIAATENLTLSNTKVSSEVESGGIGNAGNVNVTANNINISNNSNLSTATGGVGNAGEVSIIADETLNFNNSNASSAVGKEGIGTAGIVKLQAPSINVTNNSTLSTSTSGKGDAGDVILDATKNILLDNSSASSAVEIGGEGKAGNVSLSASKIDIINNSQLLTSTAGIGKAGQVIIDATDTVFMSDSSASSAIEKEGKGEAGIVTVTANNITLNNSNIFSSTAGIGDAKDIIIDTNNNLVLNNTTLSSSVETNAVGNAGSVTVNGNNITAINNSKLLTSSDGIGNAGTVNVSGITAINFNDSTASSAINNNGQGTAGIVTFNAPNLSLTNSNLSSSTSGKGNAQNVTLDGDTISLNNTTLSSSVETNAVGNGGNVTVKADNITTSNNSQILTSSDGIGNAGTVNVSGITAINFNDSTASSAINNNGQGTAGTVSFTSPNINLTNSNSSSATAGKGDAGAVTLNATGNLSINNTNISSAVEKSGIGNAGDINLSASNITIANNSLVSSSTQGQGKAGSINVTANNLEITENSQLRTNTATSFDAGNIIIKVTDNLTLTGEGTGLFASTEPGSSGNGGSIFIDPDTVNILDNATIAVNSQGTGIGGDIQLLANILNMDRGTIAAQTLSNTGGNITLILQQLLILRNQSQISTTAGNEQFGGDGGNIFITVPFIIAFPFENSDITANAFLGNGGNVTINTQALFGIQFRPNLTPFSDITASSKFGLQGQVNINTLGVDPTQGLNGLPQEQVNTEINQGCQAGKQSQLSFYNIGLSGIPPSPDDSLTDDLSRGEWVEFNDIFGNSDNQNNQIYNQSILKGRLLFTCQ